MSQKKKILLVANRLPVKATRLGKRSWSITTSDGGLVSGLTGIKEYEALWIGWAGLNVPDKAGKRSLTKALREKNCIPIFLDEEMVEDYYNGFCNRLLWPLLHDFRLPQWKTVEDAKLFYSQFTTYKEVNEIFACTVIKHVKKGEVVWVHDYHLMHVPECLKRQNRDINVGWFSHTSFPNFETFRTLPSSSELLQSVLGADLLGFHTQDYVENFIITCTRILGAKRVGEGVIDSKGRLSCVISCPIGIDPDRFIQAMDTPEVQADLIKLNEVTQDVSVIVSMDRLDPIKGILQKLVAIEDFLEKHPEWMKRVVFLQILIPTRSGIPEYDNLRDKVHAMYGRINARFRHFSWDPIILLERSVSFHYICSFLNVADVALITSLRDGMNLVSYEFVACQEAKRKKGVLILSKFAGAAQSLSEGALLVNPWDVFDVSDAIDRALNMPRKERKRRHRFNFQQVSTHTAENWGKTFVRKVAALGSSSAISEVGETSKRARKRVRISTDPK